MAKKIGEVEVTVSPDTKGFAAQTKRELQEFAKDPRSTVKIDTEIDTEKLDAQLKSALAKINAKTLTEPYRIKLHTEMGVGIRDMRKQVREQAQAYRELAETERISFGGSLDDMVKGSRGDLSITPTINEKGLAKAIEQAIGNTAVNVPLRFSATALRDFKDETVAQVRGIFEHISNQEELQYKLRLDEDSLKQVGEQIEALVENSDFESFVSKGLSDEYERLTKSIEEYEEIISKLTETSKEMRKNGESGWSQYHLGAKTARAEVERLRNEIEDLNRRRGIADLRVDMNESSLKELRSRWDELTDEIESHRAEVDVRLAEGSAAFVRGQLIDLARDRIATIWVSLRNAAPVQKMLQRSEDSAKRILTSVATYAAQTLGLRLLWTTTKNILDIVPKLDRMIPGLATLVAGLGTALPAIATGLGSLFNIGGDALASFQGLLLAPAALAGMALSIGILSRAFKDFKKVLPDVVDWFEKLGDEASAAYWVEAEKGIRSFQKAIAPLADKYIPKVADGLGRATQSFTDGLTRGANDHLEEFFENTVRGLEEASGGFDQLGESIVRMVGIGSRHFASLGKWFTNVMTDFNNWVEENDKSGNLNRWIDEAGRSIRDLGSVVYSVGSIFSSLAKGADAAGLPDLSDFAAGLREVRDVMKGNAFQEKYIDGLQDMAALMEELSTLGPKAGEALENIWDFLGDSAITLAAPLSDLFGGILDGFNSPKFQEGIRNFVTSIGSFLSTITPGVERLVEEFGSMLEIVGVAAEAWGPAFNEMLELISDVGEAIHPGFADFIENTGPNLLQLVEDLRGPAIKAADAISDLLGDEDFQEAFNSFVDSVGELVGWLLDLVPAATAAAKAISKFYNAIPEEGQIALTAGMGLLGWLPGLSPLLLGALGAVKKLAGGLRFLAGAFRFAWSASKLFRAGVILAIPAILGDTIKPTWGPSIQEWILESLGLDDTWLGDLNDAIADKFEEMFGDKTLWEMAKEHWSKAWEKFTSGDIVSGIIESLKGVSGFGEIGRAISEGIFEWLGIDYITEEELSAAWDEGGLSGVWDLYLEHLKTFTEEGLSDLVDRFLNWKPNVIAFDWASKIWEWIKGIFSFGGGSGDGSSGAASNLAAGGGGDPLGLLGYWPQIEAGIRSAVDQIVAFIKGLVFTPIDLWNLLKKWLFGEGGGGTGNPLTGILGVDGIGLGQLQSGLATAAGVIVGFAQQVGSFFGGMAAGARTKMGQLREGVVSAFQTARDRAVGIAGSLRDQVVSTFGGLLNGGLSRARSLRDGVISAFGSIRDQAASRARSLRDSAVSAFGSLRDGAISRANAMKNGFLSAMGRLRDGAANIASSAKSRVLSILGFSAGGQGSRVAATFVSALRSGLGAAVGFVRGIVSRIKGALSINAFGSGASIGSTFASGIRSKIGAVGSAASRLVNAARKLLPNSPAKEGPFSGSGWGGWGESIADQLAEGLRRGAPSVAAEANRLMGGVNSALERRVDGVSIGDSTASSMRQRASRISASQDAAPATPTVQVNVESKSDEPLKEGLRFGKDIVFSLNGSGL